MPQAHPYNAYTRTSVNTADQRQLILMLYDGAIRNTRKGIAKIEARDFEAAHNYLVRARQIVSELLSTLRPEKAGEIGENLKRLYVYLFQRLAEANLMKDVALAGEAIQILSTLREAWAGINVGQQAHQGGANELPGRINVKL